MVSNAPSLPFTVVEGGAAFSLEFALLLAVAMVGSFFLMVPPSWVYMASARRKGFDQSVIHSMLLLGLTVAGVIVVVRNSIALAFSLAGIVGAIRYRNNLTEPRDTLFILLAIGVGLAAGVGALPAAAALSMVFSYMVLLMTRMDYGARELGHSSRHLLHGPAAASPGTGEGNGKRKRGFDAVLVVRAADAVPARSVVELFLERETRRWRLVEGEVFLQSSGGRIYGMAIPHGALQPLRPRMVNSGLAGECEFEGLALDPSARVLLLPCKTLKAHVKGVALRIARWDVAGGHLAEPAWVEVSGRALRRMTPWASFNPSAIEVAPGGDHLLLLASRQRGLVELTARGLSSGRNGWMSAPIASRKA